MMLNNDFYLYLSWSTLFMVQAHIHNVLHHITPSTNEKDSQYQEH